MLTGKVDLFTFEKLRERTYNDALRVTLKPTFDLHQVENTSAMLLYS